MPDQDRRPRRDLDGWRQLGTRLQNLRDQAGLSKTALAAALHVDRTLVIRWEQGTRFPDEAAVKLAGRRRRELVSQSGTIAACRAIVCSLGRYERRMKRPAAPGAKKLGRPSLGDRVGTHVALPVDLRAEIEAIAARDEVTIGAVITRLLADSLGHPVPAYCMPRPKGQEELPLNKAS